ncbi:L-2-hydroxyglutarate oxidase [Nocardioides sp. 503]|uniref:L-2-hydroxyglutarate oxidase n=1 Tax=Nocardioides sp. 503 TaxID=2508326 RepID=UPI00106FF2C1|nr:L-2-hydroxyglutarate oxidase [Nocardioides sp. 503]
MSEQVVVVGGGILGLATAAELGARGHRVTVLEKEDRVAAHQTGRNSGVVHSGIYYAPGSLKARFAVQGARSLVAFAREHGVTVDVTGKLIVATQDGQLPQLEELRRRAEANGVPATVLSREQARELEPHVACLAALRVGTTAVVDYVGVSRALVGLVEGAGGSVLLGQEVRSVDSDGATVEVSTSQHTVRGSYLVNCAGLQSDRVARLAGLSPDVRIVPFRGEYHELRGQARHLVRGLVYPVPDPALPFLGVHLTRGHDGVVHAGPNAVLALAREGYRWGDVDVRDLWEEVSWPGSWRLARQHWRTGAGEVARSVRRSLFVRSVQELLPELTGDDLVRSGAGVRAQAVGRDGRMVDDFHVEHGPRQLHVLNAPSPAATAALEIGRHLADHVEASA